MPQPVEKCSHHRDKQYANKRDLEEVAHIIIKSPRGIIGFVRPGSEEHKRLVGGD